MTSSCSCCSETALYTEPYCASREFTPIAWWFVCKPREGAVPKEGTSNVALPTNANLAKVCLRTRLNLQPFQPRTTPLQPIKFQAQTHRRSGRVAPTLYGIRCSLTGHSETGSHSSDSTAAQNHPNTTCKIIFALNAASSTRMIRSNALAEMWRTR